MHPPRFCRACRCVCLAVAFLCIATAGSAQGPDLKKKYASEYALSFAGATELSPGWKFEGPGAEKCVRFEPEGLRLTLPTGVDGVRPTTGVKSALGIKGDFEMTLSFEVFELPAKTDAGIGTRLSLGVFKETKKPNVATISRSVSAMSGDVFVAWTSLWKENGEKPNVTVSGIPTSSKSGRLCLVRTGGDLHYGFAEGLGEEIQFKKKFPFGTEDLREVRITGSTGSKDAKLDVRVMDLRIRADGIPNQPAAAAMKPAAPPGQGPAVAADDVPPRTWPVKTLAAAAIAFALLSVLAVVGFLFLRTRSQPGPAAETEAPAAAIAVACPSCDKKFKVKAALAGKKVKCSECGTAVSVPG